MGRYFNSPSSPYLGSGTYLGGGIADRNVNLGYGFPRMEPNPEFKTNPYGLEDDQALEKWGKSKRIVGKDASEGLKRNLQGALDFITLGVADFDNRGNLFGGQHLPGLRPGSGYGGQAQLGSVPQTIPVMTPPTMGPPMGPPMGGSPVPSNTNMGSHLLQSTGIGLGNQFLSQWQTNRALDNYYDRALQTRQAADAQDVLLSQAMQRTDKGQSERATEQQSRMLGAAQANYLRRLGIKGMSDSAATKAVGGLTRSQFGSSSPVSVLGNYKAG